MSYPKRYVEQIITGLADPINEHLIKLVGFEFSPELRQHFRQELDAGLDKIQRLRMKPNNRTGTPKFYYDLLFDYPFGGVEVWNTRSIMDLISRRYQGIQPANGQRAQPSRGHSIRSRLTTGIGRRAVSARQGSRLQIIGT